MSSLGLRTNCSTVAPSGKMRAGAVVEGCKRGEPARVIELPESVRLELESVDAGRLGDDGSCCC
jgi:hypothetical protein